MVWSSIRLELLARKPESTSVRGMGIIKVYLHRIFAKSSPRQSRPERNVATLKVGMPVKIAVEAFPHEEFTGTMTNVSGGLGVPTRTMQVEIQMDNSAKKLHAGIFATAKLSMTNEDRSVLVPAAAIVVKNADTCVEYKFRIANRLRMHSKSILQR